MINQPNRVIQPNLVIPSDIGEGLDNHTLTRDGGVIRNSSNGQIVKLLKELPRSMNDSIASQTPTISMDTIKGMAIGGAIGIGLTLIVGGIYKILKSKKAKCVCKPDCILEQSKPSCIENNELLRIASGENNMTKSIDFPEITSKKKAELNQFTI